MTMERHDPNHGDEITQKMKGVNLQSPTEEQNYFDTDKFLRSEKQTDAGSMMDSPLSPLISESGEIDGLQLIN